ncbi:hypothetical protein CC86DRAFT_73383 [Ophiobolus disseminans]|uniref:Uncharacterized protein n=1 Tax=Ophiobolus disseminans TaxID=1469910 RepID=A0A6A6ZRI5_9PLEO|nr:hypothetical protein CC86DRAFT_73383 [Ophiobolus disseminans]
MTNAGLHIQLPMIPVTARQVMDLEQHTSLFTDLHFAFLACKPRGRTALVAVCLQKASRVAFPKYWRVAFDRQTLLEIKRPMHERHSIGITSFVPIWISRAPVTVDIHSKTRLPNSVETVSFELWFKDLSALGGLFSGSEMKQSKQVVAKEAYERLESLGDEVPLEFSLSERRLKHYLSSTISARGSEHDVITFHGWTKEGYGVAPGFAGIAFGVVNGYLWMELPVAHPDTMHKTLFQDYSFPVGNTWRYSGPQISVYTESRGDFEFKATARNPRYFGKFVRSNEVLTSSSESLDSLIENLTTHYLRLYVWRAQTFTGLGGIIVR